MLPQLGEAAKKRVEIRCEVKKNLQRNGRVRGGGGSLVQTQPAKEGLGFLSIAQIA
jgi:hypothetical protein